MLKYEVYDNRIKIIDSYKITYKDEMRFILNTIKEENPNHIVFKYRSISNLIKEWRAHNLLCDIHYKDEDTKDVDLDAPQLWYHKIIYSILSILYL